jgi:glucosyl-dolichyl phosphate glucuronosyltransferase
VKVRGGPELQRAIEFSMSTLKSSEVDTSVIVCTFNRCNALTTVLEDLAVQEMPASISWEVVVVDNNSTDKTREVIEAAVSRWPGRFRYVFEPQQGLSGARNRGIREASGSVMAFTDDDVRVNPDWLCSLTSNLRSGHWDGSGGRIVPVWAKALPDWMSEEDHRTMGVFVQFDAGTDPGELNRPPYGANMAFRRSAFEKYGTFRTDLGRSGNNLLSSEDTDLGSRVLADGGRLYYEPQAVVFHPAAENRMTKKFVLKWWFWLGYGEIVRLGPPSDGRWVLAGVPLNYIRRITRWTVQSLLTTNPSRRFAHMRTAWYLAGMVAACYHRSRHRDLRESDAGDVLRPVSKSPHLETKVPQ